MTRFIVLAPFLSGRSKGEGSETRHGRLRIEF